MSLLTAVRAKFVCDGSLPLIEGVPRRTLKTRLGKLLLKKFVI